MSKYSDIKDALSARDASSFTRACEAAEEAEIIIHERQEIPRKRYIPPSEGYLDNDNIQTDSGMTQMQGNPVWVPATEGYIEDYTEVIPETKEKKVLKYSCEVFFEGLKDELKLKGIDYDESKNMSYVVDIIFAQEDNKQNPVAVIEAAAAWLIPDAQGQAFYNEAQKRAGSNQALANEIYNASPEGQRIIQQNSRWASFCKRWEPKFQQVKALIDWLKGHGYLAVESNGKMNAIRGPHNGMNDIAEILATQVNYNGIVKHSNMATTMTADEGLRRSKRGDFVYISVWDDIEKAILEKMEKGLLTYVGRLMKETFTRSSQEHTGTTREMLNEWDRIKTEVGVDQKEGAKLK